MNVTAKKRLGQHFLHDPGIIGRIVGAIAPAPGQRLIEIGPGQGAITGPLLASGASLDVIELDRELIPDLDAMAAKSGGRMQVHHGDALESDLCTLSAGEPLRLTGNLPYNISTPLIFHFLKHRRCIRDMHFMLQKEVVDRMASPPGSRTYGRLSAMVQFFCEVERLFSIGPGAFNPPPKVESGFVRLLPRDRVATTHTEAFERVVRAAFAQRRKTLRNALQGLLGPADFVAADVDPGQRAEQLGVDAFARIADRLGER